MLGIVIVALFVCTQMGYRNEIIQNNVTNSKINSNLQNLQSSASNKSVTNDLSDDNIKDQPGIIKDIKTTSNGWSINVDYISRNPKWLPGVGNEPFFLNTNNRLRTLLVSNNAKNGKTKFFKCGDNETVSYGPVIEAKIEDFVTQLKKELPVKEPVYYFDIKDAEIYAIYTQCLP